MARLFERVDITEAGNGQGKIIMPKQGYTLGSQFKAMREINVSMAPLGVVGKEEGGGGEEGEGQGY